MHKCNAFIEYTDILSCFEAEICDQYLNIHLSDTLLDLNLVGNVKFGCHPKIIRDLRISGRELHLEEKSPKVMPIVNSECPIITAAIEGITWNYAQIPAGTVQVTSTDRTKGPKIVHNTLQQDRWNFSMQNIK